MRAWHTASTFCSCERNSSFSAAPFASTHLTAVFTASVAAALRRSQTNALSLIGHGTQAQAETRLSNVGGAESLAQQSAHSQNQTYNYFKVDPRSASNVTFHLPTPTLRHTPTVKSHNAQACCYTGIYAAAPGLGGFMPHSPCGLLQVPRSTTHIALSGHVGHEGRVASNKLARLHDIHDCKLAIMARNALLSTVYAPK